MWLSQYFISVFRLVLQNLQIPELCDKKIIPVSDNIELTIYLICVLVSEILGVIVRKYRTQICADNENMQKTMHATL